jgi:hypothetical protein
MKVSTKQSRLQHGVTLSGGFNTGETVSDNCAIRSQLPGMLGSSTETASPAVTASNPWCHADSGWVYRITGLASYIIPKVDVLFSTIRVAKVLKFGRVRSNVGIDVYNVLNSSTILTYNQTFSPTVTSGSAAWLAPTAVLTPRFLKISAQIDF